MSIRALIFFHAVPHEILFTKFIERGVSVVVINQTRLALIRCSQRNTPHISPFAIHSMYSTNHFLPMQTLKQTLCAVLAAIVVGTGTVFPLFAQDQQPQKPEIKAVGVEANGVERPVIQIRVDEYLSRNIHPLLNYIFFDDNSDQVPTRYTKINDIQAETFRPERLFGSETLEVYYQVLNILGFRLKNAPSEKITLTGCNSNVGVEKGNQDLSLRRAQAVQKYLTEVWKIEPERVVVQKRDAPQNPSSSKDSPADSDAENRRVEITGAWSLMQPLVISDTLREATPPTVRFFSKVYNEQTPQQWAIEVVQRGKNLKKLVGAGQVRSSMDWRINKERNSIPLDTVPMTYRLEVRYDGSPNQKSKQESLPVEQVTVQKKRRERINDIEKDRYSMILFDFGKSAMGEFNTRIAEFIKSEKRITPKSKVIITGYTDIIGTKEANKRISEDRAKSVAAGLGVTKSSVKEMVVVGRGSEQPLVYPNEYPEGRFYCRTVIVDVENPVEYDK
jgi:outer membrane protein OmpA-like peptidoglycan-associated protein